MSTALRDRFAHEPLIPKFALQAFDYLLGPAFIVTAIMLLIGLGTRLSLLAQAALYVALTVGLVLIDQSDGVAYLGIHIGLVAGALLLAEYNKFVVLKKW
jgi:thiosulfate dehydrogenase (quinone) large subunit